MLPALLKSESLKFAYVYPELNAMQKPSFPSNEEARLKELRLLEILDTVPEEEYDQITELASQICDVPVSLITLIDKDRQWFKSARGTDVRETPREYAFVPMR